MAKSSTVGKGLSATEFTSGWNFLHWNSMNKLELIDILAEESGLSKPEARKVFSIFFDSMADALAKGDRVELRGFCSFYLKKYKGYSGRNPKTGEEAKVKPKKLPFFKPGKELKDRVDR